MNNKKQAREFAYGLVQEGYRNFQELNENQKEILGGCLLENLPLIHCYEPISDADHKNEIPALLALYMKYGSKECGEEILKVLAENAVKFFSNSIDQLLEEQAREYDFNRKYDGD